MSDSLWSPGLACQAPLSTEFSRQDTGLGCHSLRQGNFSTQGWIKLPVSCISDGFLTIWATREAHYRSIHCFRQAFWDLPIGLCVNLSKNLWLSYGRIRKKNPDFIIFSPGNFPGWLAIYRPSSISIWLVLKHHTFPLLSTQIFFSLFLSLHTQPQMTQSERLWLFSLHTSFHRAPWFSGVGRGLLPRFLSGSLISAQRCVSSTAEVEAAVCRIHTCHRQRWKF